MRNSLVFGLRARHVDVLGASYTFIVGDYCLLHQTWISQQRPHAGIIVAPRQRYSVGEELRRLLRLIGTVSADEMRSRIEFLSAWF